MARNGISRLYSSSQSDTVHTWKGHWQLLIRSSEDINKDLNTRDIAFPSKPKTLSRILTSCLNVLVLGLSGKKKNLGFAGVSTGYLLSSLRLAFQCKQTEQWTGNRRRLSNYQRRQKKSTKVSCKRGVTSSGSPWLADTVPSDSKLRPGRWVQK